MDKYLEHFSVLLSYRKCKCHTRVFIGKKMILSQQIVKIHTFHRILDYNHFNGTLQLGTSVSPVSPHLKLVSFKNNNLSGLVVTSSYTESLM